MHDKFEHLQSNHRLRPPANSSMETTLVDGGAESGDKVSWFKEILQVFVGERKSSSVSSVPATLE